MLDNLVGSQLALAIPDYSVSSKNNCYYKSGGNTPKIRIKRVFNFVKILVEIENIKKNLSILGKVTTIQDGGQRFIITTKVRVTLGYLPAAGDQQLAAALPSISY